MTLLSSRCALDSLFSKEEMGWGGVARVCPSGCFGAVFPNRCEDGCSVDEVKSVGEIDLKYPFVLLVDGFIMEDSAGHVYDIMASAPPRMPTPS